MLKVCRAGTAAAAIVVVLCFPASSRGFLGVGDTSLVTVIANPAESANWAAQLANLAQQLAAARGTLEQASALRAYAGDPQAAVSGIGDLAAITSALSSLEAGGQTVADLQAAWAGIAAAQRTAAAVALLQQAGGGADGQMQVFGQAQARDLNLYAGAAREQNVLGQARGQIVQEQQARSSLAVQLSQAWTDYQGAQTQSRQQALLAKISQLEAQDQAMDARRRALLDDLVLDDRQRRTEEAVSAKAADEQTLAESAVVSAAVSAQIQAAAEQRMATLQKSTPAPAAPDYSALKLWTTADAPSSASSSPAGP